MKKYLIPILCITFTWFVGFYNGYQMGRMDIPYAKVMSELKGDRLEQVYPNP